MSEKIISLVNVLKSMKQNGAFKTYIDYIRFPYFRNLEADTKIDFNFPLTVFVGQNGGGKSSTLQALFGSPDGKSLGNYWFSTELDPIVEPDTKKRNCFIYSYKSSDVTKEVLKTRIYRKGDPDYWETSKPVARYGMQKVSAAGGRHKGIPMQVLYVDFKGILSAFDKYFYFHSPRTQTKQNYLRGKSKILKKIIKNNYILGVQGQPVNKAPIYLNEEQLAILSSILGKEYRKAGIVEHKLYGSWGTSVVLETTHQAYSEAFAGSGETAAAILVHLLTGVSDEALVLLDEPEVSLHPGAQKKLIQFVLEQTVKKGYRLSSRHIRLPWLRTYQKKP